MGDSDDDFVKASSVRKRKRQKKKKREVTGKMQLSNDIVRCPFDVMI